MFFRSVKGACCPQRSRVAVHVCFLKKWAIHGLFFFIFVYFRRNHFWATFIDICATFYWSHWFLPPQATKDPPPSKKCTYTKQLGFKFKFQEIPPGGIKKQSRIHFVPAFTLRPPNVRISQCSLCDTKTFLFTLKRVGLLQRQGQVLIGILLLCLSYQKDLSELFHALNYFASRKLTFLGLTE